MKESVRGVSFDGLSCMGPWMALELQYRTFMCLYCKKCVLDMSRLDFVLGCVSVSSHLLCLSCCPEQVVSRLLG